MSNERNISARERETRLRSAQRPARKSIEPKPDVEVIALEIDEDLDLGGDPYNRTGSHCVVEIRKD